MRYLLLLFITIANNLLSYPYTIYNKTGQKIRVTINYTINQDSREIEAGSYKQFDNGLRCLHSIKAESLQAPYQSDFWDVNCNPFTAGLGNCCTGFIVTINSEFKISLSTSDGKPIRRDRYSDQG